MVRRGADSLPLSKDEKSKPFPPSLMRIHPELDEGLLVQYVTSAYTWTVTLSPIAMLVGKVKDGSAL